MRARKLALVVALCSATLSAQTAYKYRDADGQWVFTDSAPPSPRGSTPDSFNLDHQSETLQNTLERSDDDQATVFTVVNNCLCVASFMARIVHSGDPAIADGSLYRKVLQPQSREALVRVANNGQAAANLKYLWGYALGAPDARHKPPHPYRVPFAVGSTYVISQAYPSTFTHTAPDSRYAVDIALPDGTPVYAARDGVVINTRHDAYRGGATAAMMDQANVVEILHDDGTIAMYAHLHWDSIRVHIGEHVAQGEYLANSGSTGFSTGPHLHFVVTRNTNFMPVAVPVEFAGPSGVAVSPATGASLTAY